MRISYYEFKHNPKYATYKAVNGTYDKVTKTVEVVKATEAPKNQFRAPVSINEFKNGLKEYTGYKEVIKGFGEIRKQFTVKAGTGSEQYFELDDMTIIAARDSYMQNNGTYNSSVAIHGKHEDTADLYIRVSWDGRYIAWAWNKDYCGDMEITTEGHEPIQKMFRISGIEKIA